MAFRISLVIKDNFIMVKVVVTIIVAISMTKVIINNLMGLGEMCVFVSNVSNMIILKRGVEERG